MAFNWPVFRTRALTAIVFVAVMLVGLLWNYWSFFLLFTVIHFGCWWEYFRLMEKIHQTTFHTYSKLGLMLIGYGIMLLFSSPDYLIAGYGIKENISLPVSIAGFGLLVVGIFQKQLIKPVAFGAAALGLLYISLSWGMMMELRGWWTNFEGFKDHRDFGYTLPILIIVAIWLNDTSAYLVGSFIGKTPLSKISPKKTWEGTIGGVVLSSILTGLLFIWLDRKGLVYPGINQNKLFLLAAIVSIVGTFGDLLESKLKRMAGVKDSGSIMPGHGGFLDRFDSLLLATPAVWLWLALMG